MRVQILLMYVKLIVYLLLGISGTRARSQAKKCFFRDSVNLTNIEPNENGSYVYHGILIPEEEVYQFDVSFGFLEKMKMVKPHPRGCICGEAENRYCVKLCCEIGEFFDDESNSCKEFTNKLAMPTTVTVSMKNDESQVVNIFEHFVPQVGLPCDKPGVLSPDLETWQLLETGSLNIVGENVLLTTNSYCYTPYKFENSDDFELLPMSCPISNDASFLLLLNSYGMIVSAFFFILTAIVYLALSELRGSLRGRLLISYLLVISVGYMILAFINTSQILFPASICMLMGFIGYFCFMAGFLWLGVLSFDIWMSFSNTQIKADWDKKIFLIYSLFVWSIAAILLIVTVSFQLSGSIPEALKPGISAEMCWINTKKWSAAIYFYIPSVSIFLYNIVTFTRVCIRIHRERRNVTRLSTKQKFFHENAFFILRLFLIMGISWIMDILSYCLRNYSAAEYIFAFTDFYNAIQGFFVFILLVCTRKIYKLIKMRFTANKAGTSPPSREVSMTTVH